VTGLDAVDDEGDPVERSGATASSQVVASAGWGGSPAPATLLLDASKPRIRVRAEATPAGIGKETGRPGIQSPASSAAATVSFLLRYSQ
jgi:hypothetical protein